MIKQKISNSFKTLCKELDSRTKCWDFNLIIYAESKVKNYANGDKDKLLRLKVEGSSANYITKINVLFSALAMFFSAIGTLPQITDDAITTTIALVASLIIVIISAVHITNSK